MRRTLLPLLAALLAAAAAPPAARAQTAADSAAIRAAVLAEQGAVPATPTTSGEGRRGGRGRFLVRDRVVLVDAADVDWIEAEGDYVRLHVGPRSHLVRATMAAVEAELQVGRFLRIHRSTIVNADRVRELRQCSAREWTVVLRDGTTLRLSRRYRARMAGVLGEGL